MSTGSMRLGTFQRNGMQEFERVLGHGPLSGDGDLDILLDRNEIRKDRYRIPRDCMIWTGAGSTTPTTATLTLRS